MEKIKRNNVNFLLIFDLFFVLWGVSNTPLTNTSIYT